MKNLLLVIFCITCTLAFGQAKDTKGGEFEIYTEVLGGDPKTDVAIFELDAVDNIWYNNGEDIYPLTEDFDYAHATSDSCKPFCDLIEIPCPTPDQWSYGIFHTASSSSGYPDPVYFANGKYKLSISIPNQTKSQFYFFLDYTTDDYTYGGNNDIWVKYNFNQNITTVKWNSSSSYKSISNGVTYKVWVEKNKQRSTSKFELFLTVSNQNNHPYLSWNEYHDELNMLHYNVYKKESGGAYSVIATTNNTYYADNTETLYSLPNEKTYVYYKISAQLNLSTESLYGNEEKVAVNEIQNIEKFLEENENISDESYNFKLLPNYPNPFNPSTSITYQLPKKGHVILKVYNTLGKEVTELVNETKEEGTYAVAFNGNNLPSGMYFYKIQSGEFLEVKKMLLIK